MTRNDASCTRYWPLILMLLVSGCGGGSKELTEVHGTVRFNDQPVDAGTVRFVPIEGTPGPASHARIIDSQYRVTARGGVPAGRHRVEVQAFKKTGRTVTGRGPSGEATSVEEQIPLGPPIYTTDQSPLVIDVIANTRGQEFDIVIPQP